MNFRYHIIERIIDEVGSDGIDDSLLEVPPDPKMGDFAFPCFSLSKNLKKPPQAIAEWLANKFEPDDIISEIRSSGPYINFFLNKARLSEAVLQNVLMKADDYGASNVGGGKTVVIDFSSPNIAKPFGIGHLRSTVIGSSLYKIFNAIGYKSYGVNHLGDWGTQFGKLIVAYKLWGEKEELEGSPISHLYNIYVRFHEEAKLMPELNDEARAWFKKLEDGDKEAQALWELFRELSLEEFKKYYKELDIKFDSWNGESFYNDKMQNIIDILKKKSLLVESEGAMVVELDQAKGKMPPCMIIKSDGATTYATRDLAAMFFRSQEFKPEKIIYVVGAEQQLHFNQVFETFNLMGISKVELVHAPFGRIQGISTRKGNLIFLEDVIDKAVKLAKAAIEEKNPGLAKKDIVAKQVGIGAVIFGDLVNDRIKDFVFSWDKYLSFEGETGPYLQYAHARICSIFRKHNQPLPETIDGSQFKESVEHELIKKIGNFADTIKDAASHYKPSIIAKYLVDLAQTFSNFYTTCPVLKADKKTREARLQLCKATQFVLKNGLYLLGLHAPVEM